MPGIWKRMLSIFTEEIEVTEEVEDKSARKQPSAEAKMLYQYPEKKSFRFPVIPDRQAVDRSKDLPAYQRKRNQEPERNTMRGQSRKVQEEKPTKSENPFKPTDVPSPIYGFGKQKETIRSVPAYQRKHEKQEKQFQDAETIGDALKKVSPIPDEKGELKEKLIDEVKAETIQPDNTKEDLTFVKAAVATTESHTPNKETRQEKRKRLRAVDSEKSNEIKKKPSSQTQQSSIPFNVMMSHNDKQYLEMRKDKHKPNSITSDRVQIDRQANKVQPVKQEVQQEEVQTQETNIYAAEGLEKDYTIPYHLLNDAKQLDNEDAEWITHQQERLEETLRHFHVKAKVVHATQGPSVTRFEVQPELGVKVSKVKNLSDDLKLNMSARDIRIEAPIPGKNTIGIEIPNQTAQMVGLQEIFESDVFQNSSYALPIALGLSIEGNPVVTNIQKMPHGLIAGATGSGKSVCINAILISLLYKAHHEDVKFLLIDPKMVELTPYNGIPHLVSPVITDVKAATQALKWMVQEMEARYEKFVHEGVRDMERYNQKLKSQNRQAEKLPFYVVIIDELADLMMVAPQDVEDSIARLAQKARACGIHLLVATQRPSVDVITGLIKANIPTRIAFSVSSQIDSRTIIDSSGAEKLLGRGDMLFVENGSGKSVRLQGPFVSDDEIERVIAHAKTTGEPNYLFEQEQLLENIKVDEVVDELLQEAIHFVLEQNSASTSLIQRRFKVGYNRAARLIDTLEQKGIISGQNGSKPREVLVSAQDVEAFL